MGRKMINMKTKTTLEGDVYYKVSQPVAKSWKLNTGGKTILSG